MACALPAQPPPDHAEVQLPPVETMSEGQLRGTVGVFCGGALTPGASADLGARKVDAHGSTAYWFPRDHPHCIGGVS
jgi:hypothetical protein